MIDFIKIDRFLSGRLSAKYGLDVQRGLPVHSQYYVILKGIVTSK